MRAAASLIAFLCVTLVLACSGEKGGASPGTTITIRGEKPSCATCSIVAESLAYLPHPSDTLALVQWAVPVRDSRGRYYGVAAPEGEALHVFGANGRLLQTFGKPGRGPGEFSNIMLVQVGLRDTLFIFESDRVLVFSPEYKYVREFTVRESGGVMGGILTLTDGRFILQAAPNHFSIMQPDGSVDSTSKTNPMGIALQMADTMKCMQCGERKFSEAVQPGTIWSASMHQYVVDHHDLSGKFISRVIRDVAWFPAWPADAIAGDGEMPIDNASMHKEYKKSRVIGVHQSADGLLWTFSVAPDPNNPIPPNYDFMKEMLSENALGEMGNHFVSIVEVLDPVRGELLASKRFPGPVIPVRGTLVMHHQADDVNGDALRILQLRFERK